MKRLWKPISFFLLYVWNISLLARPFDGWTHLELGAGNYGQSGRARGNTAGKNGVEACYVLGEEQFFYNDQERCHDPEKQYYVLFWTLDQMVDRYGQKGVFHVNDLYQDYALYTCYRLKEYAEKQGYDEVIIEAVVSDFSSVDLSKTLAKYELELYDHVHFKNPEPSLYFSSSRKRGQPTEEERAETRALLQSMANLSEEGLYFFTLYNDRFIPKAEREDLMELGIFYQETFLWQRLPYFHPSGGEVQAELNRVFFIETTQ